MIGRLRSRKRYSRWANSSGLLPLKASARVSGLPSMIQPASDSRANCLRGRSTTVMPSLSLAIPPPLATRSVASLGREEQRLPFGRHARARPDACDTFQRASRQAELTAGFPARGRFFRSVFDHPRTGFFDRVVLRYAEYRGAKRMQHQCASARRRILGVSASA